MFGALRLVSVEQGYDPRDFALVAFGGAGPLHANALARLLGSWPAIIPPGPGVLCALGDATTAVRDEASRTFIRKFWRDRRRRRSRGMLDELVGDRRGGARAEKVPARTMRRSYQVDVRYHGQGLGCRSTSTSKDLKKRGLRRSREPFDAEHKRLFTFALPLEHEIVKLRAVVQGKRHHGEAPGDRARQPRPESRRGRAADAVNVDGKQVKATVYDRAKLKAGNLIAGPAIVIEMDSTTLILPEHIGAVDRLGNILIYPDGHKGLSLGNAMPAKIVQTNTQAVHASSRSTPSPSTSSKARCATRASRWTPCCSAPRCRPASASSTTSSR